MEIVPSLYNYYYWKQIFHKAREKQLHRAIGQTLEQPTTIGDKSATNEPIEMEI